MLQSKALVFAPSVESSSGDCVQHLSLQLLNVFSVLYDLLVVFGTGFLEFKFSETLLTSISERGAQVVFDPGAECFEVAWEDRKSILTDHSYGSNRLGPESVIELACVRTKC